jgi:hypothetical protein
LRIQRLLCVGAVAACLVGAIKGPAAQAKGEDDLGVSSPRGYTPGETVRATITTVGSRRNLLSNSEFLRDLGIPSDGQYVVSFRRINAPAKSPTTGDAWVPAVTSLIRLPTWVEARLVFQVPSVPSGHYVVRACRVPCTEGSLVGRMEMSIGATAREAGLLFRLANAEREADQHRANYGVVWTRVIQYRNALESTRERLTEKSAEVADLKDRVWVLERKQENLSRQRLEALPAYGRSPGLVVGALVAGVLVGLAAASFVWRTLPRRGTSH